jgi:hypothetical protein
MAASTAGSRQLCLLPGGYLDEHGTLHRAVELAPLSGREEELLATTRNGAAATLVTEVLCRCVSRIGAVHPVTADIARGLLVADRQFLLLRIRELTFGDRCTGTLACPWPGCAAKVDIDFSTRDIPVRGCATIAASYRVELSEEAAVTSEDGAVHRALTFRLPTGADQEAVGPVVAADPARALTLLLERCVLGSDAADCAATELVQRMSPRARRELEAALEAHAPALDLDMALTCPECGRAFTTPLDLTDFFFGELRTSRDLLYRQVHYIAYHYHWSEHEIMALPREKRLAYIDILAEEIEAMNSAV